MGKRMQLSPLRMGGNVLKPETILVLLLAAAIGHSTTDKTPCGMEMKSRIFLDMAAEFVGKARDNIALCTEKSHQDGGGHCAMKPVDCEELLLCGNNESGVYSIWPRNKIVRGTVEVYCDMDTDHGGWTVIQRRGNYGRSNDYFFKDWESYKNGFGDIERDFWLGNDLIFAISNQREYSIRFDLRDVEGDTRHALYDNFWIEDEKEQYRLHISDFSGNANDSMKIHDKQQFSTLDEDNDRYESSCAEMYKGGWWYNACHTANLNGLYLRGHHESYADGVVWNSWKGYHESMDTSEIKLRPKDFHKSFLQPLKSNSPQENPNTTLAY